MRSAWRSVFSTSPPHLFGDARLGFDPEAHYDESLSGESGVVANIAVNARSGKGKPTKSLQAKDPVGKQVKGTIQTGFLPMATKASKPTAVGKVPHT